MKRVGEMLDSVRRPQEDRPIAAQAGGRGSGYAGPNMPEPCPICQGKGFLVYDLPPGHPDFNKLVPCRCTEARLAAERSREVRAVSNLGALERMTFDTFIADPAHQPTAIRDNLRTAYNLSFAFAREPEGWLVLMGGYGCGKTHLAAAIANCRVALGAPVLLVVVPDLLDYLRATYSATSTTGPDERLEQIREAALLILDDLGAHNATPWAQEKLFQILNYRHQGRLPTVITTNQRLDELDPRVASRIVDLSLCQWIEILAPDYRAGQMGVGAPERGSRGLSSLAFHSDQTFETFTLRAGELSSEQREDLRQAGELARAFAENPAGWLVFTGTYGCGKTHLAAAIANYQLTVPGRAIPMFVVVPDLLDHLRATFSPSSPTTLDRLFEQVKSTPLLILDDLGTESATPWAREKLFQLLNYRYAARLPTVITTFNKLEELDERLASRMEDRSRCRVHGITAPSYRGSRAQRAGNRAYEGAREDLQPEGGRGGQAPQAAKQALKRPRGQ